jgi:hypothetical protein
MIGRANGIFRGVPRERGDEPRRNDQMVAMFGVFPASAGMNRWLLERAALTGMCSPRARG